MNELALFAGAGGGLLGSKLLGWDTQCAVEIEPYARNVLLARQRDGMLEPFPIWDDIKTFDGRPWRGRIDVVSGGFPCQDISAAGSRNKKPRGLAGARSGLWFEMLRVIEEVQPMYVFVENSPNLRTYGLGTIIEGLTGLGYDLRWGVLGAWHVGAPHKRNRMWIAARKVSDSDSNAGIGGGFRESTFLYALGETERFRLWPSQPSVNRVVDGVANRVDRIRATGNGQVPQVAALAWTVLSEGW